MTANLTEIQEAGPEYARVLAEIHGECFARSWPEEAFVQLIPDPVRSCLMALYGGKPAGLLMMQCAGGEAEILTVGVRPRWRQKGLGARLMGHAVTLAARRGAARMVLEVADDNPAGQALYARLGFVPVGRRSGYYDDGTAWIDAHILEMRLSCPSGSDPISSPASGRGYGT